ncbi:MAG: phenylacetate--CoA ligase [Ruminococcaceae bacterium]|nr:phenylacetate--CoA ligase [Oscillospiraceae bacterium]
MPKDTTNCRILSPEYESLEREKLESLQGKRLHDTVKHVYENVPMYKERMDALGVTPDDIKTIDDITKLPFTDKPDLRDHFPDGLFAVPRKEIVRVQGSSGTTGKPIVSGYTQNDIDVWTEMVARALAAAGCTDEDTIQITYGYGLFTGGLGVHQGASKLGATVVPMSSGNTQRQIMMLKELGATMMCCTPSYATLIGETIREMGIDPSELKLKSGCFGAEPWTAEMRNNLEGLLDFNAFDIYGLTEIGGPGVAFECTEKCGMHINEDHVIAEIINPETGEHMPDSTPGELVFTTITKTGQPMIRYRTHDICTITKEKCACGRTTARMGRITGRSDDMIIVRGVNVFPSQIESVIVQIEGVAPHYMLVVGRENSSDTLEVQIELKEDMLSDTVSDIENLRNKISEQIKSVVGVSAKVTIVPPKTLPRFEGKAKRVIDNRKL